MVESMRRSWWSGVAVAGVLALSGCGMAEPDQATVEDSAGMAYRQVETRSFEDQYADAGERYRKFQEQVAVVQKTFDEGNWFTYHIYQDIKPQDSGARGAAPSGATRDNSYDFSTTKYFESDRDPQQVLAEVAQVWEARGWEVSSDSLMVNGEAVDGDARFRMTAPTSTNFYVYADPAENDTDRIVLRAYGPIYWGDRAALLSSVIELRKAQFGDDATNLPWTSATVDRANNNAVYLQPGDYAPFPEWDQDIAEDASNDDWESAFEESDS